MNIRDEIIKYFKYSGENSMQRIENSNYEAYCVNFPNQMGVAIPYQKDENIYETFNSIVVRSFNLENGNRYLGLFIKKNLDYSSFEYICLDFVGGDVSYHTKLQENPLEWVEKWKKLVGNKAYNANPYDLLGELVMYYYCLQKDYDSLWCGDEYPTHDIESSNKNYEVKSSTIKNMTIIHVNSQFQLRDGGNETNLFFVRFEKSQNGISINEMIKKFDETHMNSIKNSLIAMGYHLDNHIFNIKYKILEIREYKVNRDFPIFNFNQIRDDNFKSHLINMNYSISLESLEYESIKKDFLK